VRRHSRTGKLRGGGHPGASTGLVPAFSDSSVSPPMTSRTVDIRSRRSSSTASRDGLAVRSLGVPGVSGISSHGRSSGSHGAGSPRMARLTQASVAYTRCRKVSVNDHSPPTDSCSSAGSSRRARATVPSQSRSRVSHAARNPSGSVGRMPARSGYRRSSSASISGPTSTPLMVRFTISP
jgi:hypothetical protein